MKTESLDSGKYRILSEINMIPFIDVALVLLIIFMIMTPVLMKSQLKLVVPDSKAADQQDPKDRTIGPWDPAGRRPLNREQPA